VGTAVQFGGQRHLADAGLAYDEDRRFGAGYGFNLGKEPVHGRALRDQIT
jgi:hypothetical protein